MNRTFHRILLIALLWPLALSAQQLTTDNAELKSILSEIPCIELEESAATKLTLSRKDGLAVVSDNRGVKYSASDVESALSGYLRLRDICVIDDIKIKGTKRISDEAIMFRIKTSRGDILNQANVGSDIERVYDMGYFENVRAEIDEDILSFVVREYPVIVTIQVEGNDEIKDDKILDAVGLRTFEILNTRTLKAGVDRIKALYKEKGFYNVEIKTDQEDTEGGIILIFTIQENQQTYVKEVNFDGNDNIKSSELRKIMETKNRWPLGLFSHTGSYLDASIDTDLLRIEQLYGDQGYINARAGRPIVEILPEEGIFITIPIDEGEQFYIGEIDIDAELIVDKTKLLEKLDLVSGEIMNKTQVSLAIEAIRDVYMDQGFANAQITPQTSFDGNKLNMVLKVDKGEPVSIDQIYIQGNTKTRDKVIRRELLLDESDLFSSTAIKMSKDRLNRLGYFSTIEIEPIPGEGDDLSLLVNVQENRTGAFSFGLSYSSEDKVMGTLELSENNVAGYGIKAKISTEYGKKKKNFNIDVEDPWLFDTRLSAGTRLYAQEKEELYYTKKSRGFNVRMGYPVYERIRHYIGYSYDYNLGLEDIDPGYNQYLTQDDRDGGLTSSIVNSFSRDTTNDYYRPTEGADLNFSLEYAGLGGDFHYTRAQAKAAVFFPLYKDKVALMLKGRWGTINGGNGEKVPTTELFTLGGMNSVRGFKYGEIGTRRGEMNWNGGTVIGGNRMCIFNVEITYPVESVPGLSGLFFYDAGNAYNDTIDLTNLKQSVGFGWRWVTPMGPLRLEYGRIINPEEYESNGRWDFTIGTFF